MQRIIRAERKAQGPFFPGKDCIVVQPPGDFHALAGTFEIRVRTDYFFVGLVRPFAMPGVNLMFLAFFICKGAFGKPEEDSPMVGELSARAFGQETLSIGLINMVKGFVSSFAIFGVHAFVDITNERSLTEHKIGVLTWLIDPGKGSGLVRKSEKKKKLRENEETKKFFHMYRENPF